MFDYFTTTSITNQEDEQPFTIKTLFEEARKLKSISSAYLPALRIVEDRYMIDQITEQIKFPRSRKKRIQKKFKKIWTRTSMKPKKECFIDKMRGLIICHPVIAAELRKLPTVNAEQAKKYLETVK